MVKFRRKRSRSEIAAGRALVDALRSQIAPPAPPFIPPRSYWVEFWYEHRDAEMRYRAFQYQQRREYNLGGDTMEIEKILEQMQAKTEEFKAKRDKILTDQGHRLSEMGVGFWSNRRAAEEKKAAIIAEAQGRIEAAERQLRTELDALRKQGEEAHANDNAEIAARYYDGLHERDPHGAAQWQEAAARAAFVKSDLLGLPSADVVRYYLHADARGDVVGRYLAGTIGREVLQARLSEHEPLTAGHAAASEALHDLRSITVGAAEARRDDDMARLKDLHTRIKEPMAPSEVTEMVGNLGVNVHPQPVVVPEHEPGSEPEFRAVEDN